MLRWTGSEFEGYDGGSWSEFGSGGGSGSGVSEFINLTDTPSTYTSNKFLLVNAGGTGIGFADAVSGTQSYIAKFSSGGGVEESQIVDDGTNINMYVNERVRKKTKNPLVDAATVIWDMDNGNNADVTITTDRTLQINNVQIGDYGTIVIKQGNSNGNNLGLRSLQSNYTTGGSNVINEVIICTINSTDIASFYYDGTDYYWTIGFDYKIT